MKPIKVFISDSHKNEQFRKELSSHLRFLERLGVGNWDKTKWYRYTSRQTGDYETRPSNIYVNYIIKVKQVIY